MLSFFLDCNLFDDLDLISNPASSISFCFSESPPNFVTKVSSVSNDSGFNVQLFFPIFLQPMSLRAPLYLSSSAAI